MRRFSEAIRRSQTALYCGGRACAHCGDNRLPPAERHKPSGGKAQANVLITPLENPTYAINAGEDMFQGGVGWFYEFQYEETAGVPFTINEFIVTTIADSGYEYNDYYTSDDVTKWLGSPTLRAGEPQSLRGGFPLGPAQGVRITLNGTDANGNELSFSGYVELSKEIKE